MRTNDLFPMLVTERTRSRQNIKRNLCPIRSRNLTMLRHYPDRATSTEGDSIIRSENRGQRNGSFRNYRRRKSGGREGGVLSLPCSSNLCSLRTQATTRKRGIILLGGMQSGRLWGTEIAGLEERLGGLVARFQKTNVPLEVEEERFPFDADTRLDIISSHRRIMRRAHVARVCPRETKGTRLSPFVSTSTVEREHRFLDLSLLFSFCFLLGIGAVCERFEGLEVRQMIRARSSAASLCEIWSDGFFCDPGKLGLRWVWRCRR